MRKSGGISIGICEIEEKKIRNCGLSEKKKVSEKRETISKSVKY